MIHINIEIGLCIDRLIVPREPRLFNKWNNEQLKSFGFKIYVK